MNATVNGSRCSSPLDSTAQIIGKTFAYTKLFFVSLTGNSFNAVIVYRSQTLRKPINFFIVNMAMSDLLFSILIFPWELAQLLRELLAYKWFSWTGLV